MWLFQKSKTKISSRKQLQIQEVKDDILILPHHEYRLVIETSSINFELKSDEEQDAIIDTFQNFLNSLPCKVQILIRIRELDVDQYLAQMQKNSKDEKEKVYQEQLVAYNTFISKLVTGNKILSRKFYVVIPYEKTHSNSDFNVIKEKLFVARDIVSKGLEKMGMKVRFLNSLETLDLFYSFYNQNSLKTQPLKKDAVFV